jgi:hypothetical protein
MYLVMGSWQDTDMAFDLARSYLRRINDGVRGTFYSLRLNRWATSCYEGGRIETSTPEVSIDFTDRHPGDWSRDQI